MRFKGTLICVEDINEAREFYETLFDLNLEYDFGTNVSFGCGLSLQQDFHELVHFSAEDIRYGGNDGELYFETEDVDSFLKKVKQIYPETQFIHGIKEHNWGQRVLRFYDFDQHIIEVGESMERVVRRFLDQGLTLEKTAEKSQMPLEFVKACKEGLI